MSQQVNLFEATLRPPRELLTLGLVVLLSGVAAGAMAGYNAHLAAQLREAQAQQAAVAALLKQAQGDVSALAKPSAGRNAGLEADIAKAQAEVKSRDLLVARLKGEGLGNTRGFSEYLMALARQRVDGAWITGVSVFDGGGDFSIRGGVTRADILPDLIRGLNREEVLRGRQIAEFRMQSKEVQLRDERAPQGAAAGTAAPGAAGPAAGAAGTPAAPAAAAQPPAARVWRYVEFSIGSSARPSQGG